jgi:hypothetical protein
MRIQYQAGIRIRPGVREPRPSRQSRSQRRRPIPRAPKTSNGGVTVFPMSPGRPADTTVDLDIGNCDTPAASATATTSRPTPSMPRSFPQGAVIPRRQSRRTLRKRPSGGDRKPQEIVPGLDALPKSGFEERWFDGVQRTGRLREDSHRTTNQKWPICCEVVIRGPQANIYGPAQTAGPATYSLWGYVS